MPIGSLSHPINLGEVQGGLRGTAGHLSNCKPFLIFVVPDTEEFENYPIQNFASEEDARRRIKYDSSGMFHCAGWGVSEVTFISAMISPVRSPLPAVGAGGLHCHRSTVSLINEQMEHS